MSMSKGDLKDKLLKATKDLEDTSGIGEIGNAIKEYVEKNAEGTVGWSGLNPAIPQPDTTTKLDWELKIPALVLSPSQVNQPAAAMSVLGTQLLAGLSGGMIVCKDKTFVPPMLSMVMIPSLSMINTLSISGDDREKAMDQLADQVIKAITTAPVPPVPGIRAGVYLPAPGMLGPIKIS